MSRRCRYCHRPLSDPASAAAGYGPVCARRHGHRTITPTRARSPARTPATPRHDTDPGQQQLALDLEDTDR